MVTIFHARRCFMMYNNMLKEEMANKINCVLVYCAHKTYIIMDIGYVLMQISTQK